MTSRRAVLIAFGVALAAFVGTHLLPIPGSVHQLTAAMGGQPILDMKPSFSADETYQRLAAFGEAGRAAYRRTVVTTDVVFPFCVLAFLFLLARYTADRLNPSRPLRVLLLAVPIICFLSDMAENAGIFVMLSDFPERHELVASYLGYLTVIKRVSQVASIVLPAILFFADGARRLGSTAES